MNDVEAREVYVIKFWDAICHLNLIDQFVSPRWAAENLTDNEIESILRRHFLWIRDFYEMKKTQAARYEKIQQELNLLLKNAKMEELKC